MKFRLPHKLLAIDLEATGADEDLYSICQIGAILLDKDCNDLGQFSMYVKPLNGNFTQEAMDTHKLPWSLLNESPELGSVLEQFENFAKGHNVVLASWSPFDAKFLRKQYLKIGRPYPFSYKCFDIKSVVLWEKAKSGNAEFNGLETCVAKAGLKWKGKAHDALYDIINSVDLLRHYMDKYRNHKCCLE